MCRSFITKEYQRKRLPLFLLWRGILRFVLSDNECHHIIGPVSISGKYTKLSRMIIVEFIKKYYFDEKLAEFVKPRKRFKVDFKRTEGAELLKNTKNDLRKIDQIISDIEPTLHRSINFQISLITLTFSTHSDSDMLYDRLESTEN